MFEYITNITQWCSDSATGWWIWVGNPVRRKNFSILQKSILALAQIFMSRLNLEYSSCEELNVKFNITIQLVPESLLGGKETGT